jgi:hypothetical protein
MMIYLHKIKIVLIINSEITLKTELKNYPVFLPKFYEKFNDILEKIMIY